MNLWYYPGCTLKTRAKNAEDSAIVSMAALGIDMVELPRWNCCGTVHSLAGDDLIHHIAPVRDLIRVKEQGGSKVATICSFCYNTLRRADILMRGDAEKRGTINSFMDEEPDYNGEVDVVHLLQVLRDDIGWKAISEKVKLPLEGLKVASYYGCTLLRPAEVAIDNVEKPTVMQDLLRALGATVIEFPFATECCGSYQIVGNVGFALEAAKNILTSALRRGAEAVVLTCPMCDYNLGLAHRELKRQRGDLPDIPTLYFSQLLAIALGLDTEVCHFNLNYIDPQPLLQSKGLIVEGVKVGE